MKSLTDFVKGEWAFINVNDFQAFGVAKKVKSNPNLLTLKILTFLDPGMGVAGGKAILKAVRKHPTISHLDIKGNSGMGDHVGIAIYKLLVNNKTLTSLNLTDCGLTDKTAGLIAEGIKHNSTLKYLEIRDYNNFTKGLEQIENAAKERSIPLTLR